MDMHFATFWEQIAAAIPDKPALIHGQVRRSWSEYNDRAARLATLLSTAGLTMDSKVSIYLHNCNEYLEAQFGIFKVRACPINVNYRYLEDELVYLLDNSDSEAIFFQACYADRIKNIRSRLPKLKLLIQIDDGTGDLLDGALDYETVIADHPPFAPIERSDSDLYMLYTGGTTGMPKGVMYENGGMCSALNLGYAFRGMEPPETVESVGEAVRKIHEANQAPVSLVGCPLMHGTGMWVGSMIPLNQGGSVITLPNVSFDPELLWQTAQQEQATDITIVGDAFAKPMLNSLDQAKRNGRPFDISSVNMILSSGVMWTSQVKEGLLAHKDMILYDAMGSSEGGMGTSVTTKENVNETASFEMGENTKVFTDDDREVKPGSGEIGMIAAGGNVPLGYYKDPEKSARTFREINGVRYSFPGDFATIEADGTINLLGRGSMCINTGGEKVFPEEVEETVKLHPAIFDCLTVGVADNKFGEKVVALASFRENMETTQEEVISSCRSHLAGYKLPKEVLFVPEVQRASNGKADYKWAKATALEMLGG